MNLPVLLMVSEKMLRLKLQGGFLILVKFSSSCGSYSDLHQLEFHSTLHILETPNSESQVIILLHISQNMLT